MSKKPIDPQRIKNAIIVNVIDFLDSGDCKYQAQAIENLNNFAKEFRVPLTFQGTKEELIKTLKEFILNIDGYNITIPNLYRSLK